MKRKQQLTDSQFVHFRQEMIAKTTSSAQEWRCVCGNASTCPMLIDHLWTSIAQGARFLCWPCVETRLARELVKEDLRPRRVDTKTASARVVKRKQRRRCLGGVWLRCLSPGNWLSESNTIAAMYMMEGTPHAMWELYLTQLATGAARRMPRDPDTADFLCADLWCSAFTFGELADDITKLADWSHNLSRNIAKVAERQDQDHRWGFGPPDPKLGWYPHETGRKARQPSLRGEHHA